MPNWERGDKQVLPSALIRKGALAAHLLQDGLREREEVFGGEIHHKGLAVPLRYLFGANSWGGHKHLLLVESLQGRQVP